MPAFHPRLRALVVGASALALVAIGVGGTVAASNPPTLYACFNTSGAVSMSASALCLLPGGGRLATINAAGVAGPAGATGVAGPTGATGATGPTAPVVRHQGTLAAGDVVTVDYDQTRIYFNCVGLHMQSFVNGIVHMWGPGVVGGGAGAGSTSAGIGAGATLDFTAVATGASGAPVVYEGLITSGGPAGQPCTYDFFGPA